MDILSNFYVHFKLRDPDLAYKWMRIQIRNNLLQACPVLLLASRK